MGRLKYSPEKIIEMLREAEVKLSQGMKPGQEAPGDRICS